jgi:hypothetical protein
MSVSGKCVLYSPVRSLSQLLDKLPWLLQDAVTVSVAQPSAAAASQVCCSEELGADPKDVE